MNRKRYNKLHQIYRRIPAIKCKGLCYGSCTVLGMTKGEAENMTRTGGKPPTVREDGSCVYLENKRCSIYNERPGICRVWGAAPKLACPFGCSPVETFTEYDSEAVLRSLEKEFGEKTDPVFNATDAQVSRDIDITLYLSSLTFSMYQCDRCRQPVLSIAVDSVQAETPTTKYIDIYPNPRGDILIMDETKTAMRLNEPYLSIARSKGAFLHTVHKCEANID